MRAGAISSEAVVLPQRNVLIVDDLVVCGLPALKLLGSIGYHGYYVNSGKEAEKAIEGKKFSATVLDDRGRIQRIMCVSRVVFKAILMDIEMPEQNGYETTRNIRSLEDVTPPNQPNYIIAHTTVHFSASEKSEMMEVKGFNSILEKPANSESLRKALDEIVFMRPSLHSGASTVADLEEGVESLRLQYAQRV